MWRSWVGGVGGGGGGAVERVRKGEVWSVLLVRFNRGSYSDKLQFRSRGCGLAPLPLRTLQLSAGTVCASAKRQDGIPMNFLHLRTLCYR